MKKHLIVLFSITTILVSCSSSENEEQYACDCEMYYVKSATGQLKFEELRPCLMDNYLFEVIPESETGFSLPYIEGDYSESSIELISIKQNCSD